MSQASFRTLRALPIERSAPANLVNGQRPAETHRNATVGETKMLTGVMCGSYHDLWMDVWMELHEDLILAQGIDRAEEGSF